jgi:hypothetical protein
MYVGQATTDGCLFACVAMLQRAVGIVDATEATVRAMLSVPLGPCSFTGRRFQGVTEFLDQGGLLHQSGWTLRELAAVHEVFGLPSLVIVNRGLSHNLQFAAEPAPLQSPHGTILPYIEPVVRPEPGGLQHAMVLVALHEATDSVDVLDPWYCKTHQPTRIKLDVLVRYFVDGPYVLARESQV